MDIYVKSILLSFLPYLACVERFMFNTLKVLMDHEWRMGIGYQEMIDSRFFWDGWGIERLRVMMA